MTAILILKSLFGLSLDTILTEEPHDSVKLFSEGNYINEDHRKVATKRRFLEVFLFCYLSGNQFMDDKELDDIKNFLLELQLIEYKIMLEALEKS